MSGVSTLAPGGTASRGSVILLGGGGHIGRRVVPVLLDEGYSVIVATRGARPPAAVDPRAVVLTRWNAQWSARELEGELAGLPPLCAAIALAGRYSEGPAISEGIVVAAREMMHDNLYPVLALAEQVLPGMTETGAGTFVAIGSSALGHPWAGSSAYLLAKAALVEFVSCIGAEYGSRGIRAHSLLSGVVDTEANRDADPTGDPSSWVRPEDIASLIVFLLSESSAALRNTRLPLSRSAQK